MKATLRPMKSYRTTEAKITIAFAIAKELSDFLVTECVAIMSSLSGTEEGMAMAPPGVSAGG